MHLQLNYKINRKWYFMSQNNVFDAFVLIQTWMSLYFFYSDPKLIFLQALSIAQTFINQDIDSFSQ